MLRLLRFRLHPLERVAERQVFLAHRAVRRAQLGHERGLLVAGHVLLDRRAHDGREAAPLPRGRLVQLVLERGGELEVVTNDVLE